MCFIALKALMDYKACIFCWNLTLITMKACAIEPDINTKPKTLEHV